MKEAKRRSPLYSCNKIAAIPTSRRSMLRRTAAGFGALATAALWADQLPTAQGEPLLTEPFAPHKPHFAPRARNIIFLYMDGGPSQVDSFDPTPRLEQDHRKPFAMEIVLKTLQFNKMGLTLQSHSLLYLAVLVAGFLAMVPLIIRAERRGAVPMKRLAVVLLAVSQLLLALAGAQLWHFVLALLVFFTAFNLLEALLPSLVGRAAPAGTRGTAMGVYSTSQFLGVFVGGQMGGALYLSLIHI